MLWSDFHTHTFLNPILSKLSCEYVSLGRSEQYFNFYKLLFHLIKILPGFYPTELLILINFVLWFRCVFMEPMYLLMCCCKHFL
jgi:hypothetical protein